MSVVVVYKEFVPGATLLSRITLGTRRRLCDPICLDVEVIACFVRRIWRVKPTIQHVDSAGSVLSSLPSHVVNGALRLFPLHLLSLI